MQDPIDNLDERSEPLWITLREASKLTGADISTIREWVKSDKITHTRMASKHSHNQIMVDREETKLYALKRDYHPSQEDDLMDNHKVSAELVPFIQEHFERQFEELSDMRRQQHEVGERVGRAEEKADIYLEQLREAKARIKELESTITPKKRRWF